MPDWTNPVSGNWTDATKWTGGVPNAAGATANFIVPNPGSATLLIYFSQSAFITVGTLNVTTDSDQGWTFQGDTGVTSATLRFLGVGGGPAFLNVETNNSTRTSKISDVNGMRVTLASDLIVTTTESDSFSNTFFQIAAPITSSHDIYKFGSGTLRLSGNNPSFTGDLFVNAGRFEVTNGSALDSSNVIKLNNDADLAAVSASFTLSSNIETGSGDASGEIVAETGKTLTLTGQLELRSSHYEAIEFGNAADTGTIVLSGTSLINGAGGFSIDGGTVRFGNAGAAANYFAELSANAQVQVGSGATLDTGGFAAVIDNLDMDGGTLRSTGGALDLTINQTTSENASHSGTIVGTAGADRLVLSVSGAFGADFELASFTSWNSSIDTITLNGSDNANTLTGSTQNDTINGLGGNDTLRGFGGIDIIRGGTGNDIYQIADTLSTLIELAGEGTDAILVLDGGPASFTLAPNFENLTFSDSNTHNGTGNAAVNVLTGGNGTDTLNGGGGADTLNGRGGNDTYHVDAAGDAVIESAGAGNDVVYASTTYTLTAGAHVETLSTSALGATTAINLAGNELAQAIYGNAGVNSLSGGGGNDSLFGLGGNDVLNGSTGNDSMNGGTGNDTYHVDAAGDVIQEAAAGGSDVVYTSVSYALTLGAEVETMSTTAQGATTALNLSGNAFGQTIYGNAGANVLNGGGGNDALIGLGGNDVYHVDAAGDVVNESAGAGNDVVYASASYTLGAGAHVETLSTSAMGGTTAINLTGNALGQVIYGNAGANMLNGGGGNDTLIGLGGADTFAFTTALGAGNLDTISGYSVADDVIHIDNAVFTGLAAGALAAGAFATGAAAADADDRIIYNSATGALLFDADGVGGAAAVQFAALSAGLAMTAGEFVVI